MKIVQKRVAAKSFWLIYVNIVIILYTSIERLGRMAGHMIFDEAVLVDKCEDS